MEAYKAYIDYLVAGNVVETAYILGQDGSILGTNLPITQMPRYEFDLEDEKDPSIKHKVVVDQKANLIEAIQNKGVCKNSAGIRIYNQKYYTVHYDEDNKSIYLKKEKGGGCICQTKNFIVIGTFNSQIKMQNGVAQNPGELNTRVQALAKDLISKNS